MRHAAFLMLGAAGVLAASLAHAQPAGGDDKTRARVLGKEAAERLIAKDYAAAIERVMQAESLFHAPTHLRILAEAQEGLGHLAEAMGTYERLVAEPLPVGAHDAFHDAQKVARQRLRDLASRVPSLLITVRGAGAAEAVTTVDGRAIAAAGTAVRLDAGAHKVRVEAPGLVPFERVVTLPPRGGVVVIEASLQRATAAPEAIPAAPADRPIPAPPADRPIPAPPPERPLAPRNEDEASAPSRIPVFIAFGTGAAGLVVGAVTGAMSLSQVSDLKDRCPADQCGTADQPDIDHAEALATASTIGFAVGAAGAAAGVLLLLFLPDQGPPSSRSTGSSAVHASPWIGLGAAGIRGSF